MSLNKLYAAVTRDIITQLEAGTVPWTRPWRSGQAARILPYNAVTGREYHGINIPILWRAAEQRNFPTHAWLTYHQARAAGAQVRKGERGTTVVFSKRLRLAHSDDEERTISLLRRFVVFNVAQVDDFAAAAPAPPSPAQPVASFVAATNADIRLGRHATYVPSRDLITMPAVTQFESEANQQTSNTTSVNGIDPGNCGGTPNCYVLFQPIPQQRPLIVQHLSCIVSPSTGDLQFGLLRTRKGQEDFPLRRTWLLPVHMTGNDWILNSPVMHLLKSGERAQLSFTSSAADDWFVSCSISGKLQQP